MKLTWQQWLPLDYDVFVLILLLSLVNGSMESENASYSLMSVNLESIIKAQYYQRLLRNMVQFTNYM